MAVIATARSRVAICDNQRMGDEDEETMTTTGNADVFLFFPFTILPSSFKHDPRAIRR